MSFFTQKHPYTLQISNSFNECDSCFFLNCINFSVIQTKLLKMLYQKLISSSKLCVPKLISLNFRTMSVKSTFLQIEELGEPHKVLKKCETQLDSPKDNEVLVKILAAPINPAVINIIQGTFA